MRRWSKDHDAERRGEQIASPRKRVSRAAHRQPITRSQVILFLLPLELDTRLIVVQPTFRVYPTQVSPSDASPVKNVSEPYRLLVCAQRRLPTLSKPRTNMVFPATATLYVLLSASMQANSVAVRVHNALSSVGEGGIANACVLKTSKHPANNRNNRVMKLP